MPIRINFLAEEQAADDLRRQDPVKRAILGGVVLVVLTLAASGFCQLKVNGAKADLAKHVDAYGKLEKKEKEVKDGLRKTGEMEKNLGALLQLATNRFTWGPVLNAFQSVAADNIQIVSFKGQQTHTVVAPVEPRKDSADKRKPGMSTETVVLVVEGNDTGPVADTSYLKYMDTLAKTPYFKEHLSKEKGWRLKGIPEEVPGSGGKPLVPFKLEGFYLEKVRNE